MLTATRSVLSTSPVTAVLPAIDIERAESFYRDVLGLETEHYPGLSGYFGARAGDGTSILVYEREGTKAEHTVAEFAVKDLASAVRELRERGVVFEEYDLPGLKTVDGIATMGTARTAWFKDTEGNIIAVSQT